MSKLYKKAALGGTFDRFHLGHQQLITTALDSAETVVIGVTKEHLLTDKTLKHLIEPYDVRISNVKTELNRLSASNRAEIVPLETPEGPTLTDLSIDAIVVSTQTKPGGDQINQERIKLGLPALPLVEAVMIRDELGEHLSSTQIRQGKVSRLGRAYASLFNTDINFSPDVLNQLKTPQGTLMKPDQVSLALLESLSSIVLVGDTVTRLFVDHNLPFHLAIVDGQTNRQPTHYSFSLPQTTISDNPAGSIKSKAAADIIHLLEKPTTIPHLAMVNGEEDLLAFVPSLVSPIDGAVFYGQPNQGIVMIKLTETEKIRLARLINQAFE